MPYPIKFPMICTADERCENTAKYWLEVEVNLALACEEHYTDLKKIEKVYSEGLLPKTTEETQELIRGKMVRVHARLVARGIEDPKKFRMLENEILGSIKTISPKRFNKLRKQYAKLGANDDDLKLLDDRYKTLNNFENRNGITHPMCSKCGRLATWWYDLRTRKVFRCENHKKEIESPVYDQGIISKNGVPTKDNDFYQRIDDYLTDGDHYTGQKYSFDELVAEIKDCSYCNNIKEIADKYFESDKFVKRSIAHEVDKHIRDEHPKHYSQYSVVKNGVTRSYILEESDDFFENFMRIEKRIAVPKQFVGEIMSGDVRDAHLLQNASLFLEDADGVKQHISRLLDFLEDKKLQPITVCRLLQNLDMVWEIKYNVLKKMFGEDNPYTQYIKGFEKLATVMENCEECIKIGELKKKLPDQQDGIFDDARQELFDKITKHFAEAHPEEQKFADKLTHEKNLEQKYPYELRKKLAEIFNNCITCNQIINDEEIPDQDAERIYRDHVNHHHKETRKLGINVEDIMVRPDFWENTVSRKVKLTTISDEPILKDYTKHINKAMSSKPKYADYEEFQDYISNQRIFSKTDWITLTKTKDFPKTIPIKPEKIYPEFSTYPEVFKYVQKVRREPLTKEKIKQIIREIGERWLDYKEYPDAFLLKWFSTQGLLTVHDIYFRNLFKNFIQWRNDPEGINALRYWISTEDYEKEFGEFSLHPKKEETVTDFLDRQKTTMVDVRKQQLLEQVQRLGIDAIIANTKNVVPRKDEDPKWYWTQVQFRVKQIWEDMFDQQNVSKKLKVLMTEKKTKSNEFHDDVMEEFWNEWNKVNNLDYKRSHYSFQHKPTLLQLYVAYKMTEKNGYFTMTSTGTGKTGQSIISAITSEAKCCLYIVPNPIVEQVARNVKKFYKECYVKTIKDQRKISKELIPHDFFQRRRLTSFYVVNYDMFRSKNAGEKFIQKIKDLTHGTESQTIDFVILDESHFVKISSDPDDIDKDQRKISNRRKNIEMVIDYLRDRNRKLKTLMATATPTVNNILEAKSQLEMVTGTKFNFSTHAYIKNAISCYVEFIPYSVSYVKHYNITERGSDKPVTVNGFLPEHLTEKMKIELSYLELEQIATKYRIPKIIELIKKSDGGVVIFTDYKTGIVDQLMKAVVNAGYKVGFFTGDDKSGLEPFKAKELDVLIATRPFAVGIDEVQYNCNTLIFNGLVWTWAMFEQIRGRLIREGQGSNIVDIHLVFAKLDGFEYDEKIKYNRILAKKALGDCIRDGTLPEELGLGSVEKDRKNAINQMIENGKSGFPEKEETERLLAEQAMKDLESKSESLDEEIEEIKEIKGELNDKEI